jgi:LruC domain-containing protein
MKIYLCLLLVAVLFLSCNKGGSGQPPFFVIPSSSGAGNGADNSSTNTGVETTVSEGAKIKNIQIEAARTSILPNQHTELSAWAIYSDGNKINVTDLALWELKDPTLLQFEEDISSNSSKSFRKTNSDGDSENGFKKKRYKGISPGTTKVRATVESITGECELSIDGYPIDHIEVSSIPFIPIGFSDQFKAVAVVRNGSIFEKKDITTSVTWSLSNNNGTIDKNGYFTALSPGNIEIFAKFSGMEGSTTTNLSKTKIINLSISGNKEIVKGTISQLQVTAIYEDKTYLDVTNQVRFETGSEKETLKLNYNGISGMVFGSSEGEETVIATLQSITTEVRLRITAPAIASLSINPKVSSPKGVGYQFIAIATFTDGSIQNVTSQTTWVSLNPNILSITNDPNNAGYALGRDVGSVKVEAAISKVTASSFFTVTEAQLISISISGENSIAKGLSTPLRAVGYYSDGSTNDLTNLVVWSKVGTGVINNNEGQSGNFFGNQIGVTKITAQLGSLVTSYSIEVTEAKLTSISISSPTTSLPVGMEAQLTATGIYSDNTKIDLTNTVTWMYDGNGDGENDSILANIYNVSGSHGKLTAVAKGNGKAIAKYQNLSASLQIPITSAELISFSLGAPQTISNGLQGKITAVGTFSDGSTKDITSEIKFSTTGKIFIDQSTGVYSTNGTENASVTALLGKLSNSLSITVTEAVLSSISVTTDKSSLAKGVKTKLKATGIYTDNSTVDMTNSATWITDSNEDGINDTLIGRIDTTDCMGEFSSINPGIVTVIAMKGNISGSTKITVTPATLVTLSLGSPKFIANGLQLKLVAIGTYSDNSTQDLTNLALWSSSGKATIGNDNLSSGIINTNGEETVTITANVKGAIATVTITVLPAEITSLSISATEITQAKGTSQKIQIGGYFTDGSIRDITSQVTFSIDSNGDGIDDSLIASISNLTETKGSILAISEGKAIIKASIGKVSITSNLLVSPADLKSITITPANTQIAKGLTQKFTATGFYTDNSTRDLTSSVTWGISAPTSLLIPVSSALMGNSTTNSIASISNATNSKGIALGQNTGSIDVTATLEKISGTAKLTVGAAELVSLNITSSLGSKAKGLKEQFTAVGLYTDGSGQDLTSQVNWKSDSNSDSKDDCLVACISNELNEKGLVTAVEVGETKISATIGSVTATKIFNVSPAVLSSISVESANSSIPNGLIEKMYAIGTYSDNTSRDISSNVTWTLDSDGDGLNDTKLASITNLSNTSGYIKTSNTGSVKVTASLGSISSSKTISILPAILKSITVYPPTATLVKGFVQQYTATGVYTDESRADITASATWISDSNNDGKDDTLVGSMSNSTSTKGLVSGMGVGKSTITAVYQNQTYSSILNVVEGTTVGSGKDGLVQLDVVSCKDTIFNYQANRVIGISATVVDQKGNPVAGALVELFNPNGNTLLFSQISSPTGKLAGSIVVNYTDTGILATMAANVTANGTKQVSVPIRREESGDIKLVVNILGIQVSTETVDSSTPTVVVVDTDKDGVPDSRDAFPNDANKAFKLRIPSTGYYTVTFEDLYPNLGDADLNDFTLYMVNEEDLNAKGEIVEIRSNFQHVAKGAGYNHELFLRLPAGISVSSFETKIYDGAGTLTSLGTRIQNPTSAQTNALSIYNRNRSDFTLYNVKNDMLNQVFRPGYIAKTSIKFTIPVNRTVLGTAPYDLYAFVHNTNHEIHFPGKVFTNNVDRYIDPKGFPWALIIPGGFQWPLSGKNIYHGYPKFSNWSQSFGAYDSDWFKYFIKENVYTIAKEPNSLVTQ